MTTELAREFLQSAPEGGIADCLGAGQAEIDQDEKRMIAADANMRAAPRILDNKTLLIRLLKISLEKSDQ